MNWNRLQDSIHLHGTGAAQKPDLHPQGSQPWLTGLRAEPFGQPLLWTRSRGNVGVFRKRQGTDCPALPWARLAAPATSPLSRGLQGTRGHGRTPAPGQLRALLGAACTLRCLPSAPLLRRPWSPSHQPLQPGRFLALGCPRLDQPILQTLSTAQPWPRVTAPAEEAQGPRLNASVKVYEEK